MGARYLAFVQPRDVQSGGGNKQTPSTAVTYRMVRLSYVAGKKRGMSQMSWGLLAQGFAARNRHATLLGLLTRQARRKVEIQKVAAQRRAFYRRPEL